MSTNNWAPSNGVVDDDILAAIDKHVGGNGLTAEDWLVASIHTTQRGSDMIARCVVGNRTWYVAGEYDASVNESGNWSGGYAWHVMEVAL